MRFPREKTQLYKALSEQEYEDKTAGEWDLQSTLLASVYDSINMFAWAMCNGKDKDRPKPLKTPFNKQTESKITGKHQYSLDEIKAKLGHKNKHKGGGIGG